MESSEREGTTNPRIGRRWFNGYPQQRDRDSNEPRPHEDDSGRLPPPPHQPFSERVEMSQNPEAKEHSDEQPAPLRDNRVQGSAHAHSKGNQVDQDNGQRRNHQPRPLHDVELGELVIDVIVVAAAGKL
ncbi:hypothetical protein M5K25_027253 [Dendrobium thyrsiflorum]|uniref:Uncharacterized protein n=1 Tax=Dendrobium thyrsiflorum TaxID=117978 RepID=A0ABD0TZE0_DENTH